MKKIYTTLALLLTVFATQLFAQTPYASYPLDGNANDTSGNNLNGTITGNPTATTNRNGVNGKALLFSGDSSYIDLPTDFDFPNRTVIAWFNVSQVPSGNGNPIYVSDHNGLVYGATFIYVLENTQNADVIHFGTGASAYDFNLNLNTWYQAVITRTPTSLKMYVNGTLYSTVPNPSSYSSSNGVTHATVGTDRIYGTFTVGKIDDLSIYDVALTDEQITGNYTSLKDVHEIDDHLTAFVQQGNVVCNFTGDFDTKIKAVRLVDINGKVLVEKQGMYSGILNENDLPAGVYFVNVEIENAARTVSRKVVVVK